MFNKTLIVLSSVLAVLILLLFVSCGGGDSTEPDNTTIPVLTTSAVSAITQTTAECGGTITSDGGATVTARGVCWSTNATPTIADDTTNDGTGTGSFTSSITGLTAGTPYYVRAYAINSAGTGYGEIRPFDTEPSGNGDSTGTVTDIDDNIYQTIKIGDQWWMAENLKVTHYRNGDSIPNVTNNYDWDHLTTGAFCNYNNDEGIVAVYGRLYNWFAGVDSRDLAPTGWHMPSDDEWQVLADYLGGDSTAGGKMKEVGTTHWVYPNTGATNESGFTALPGLGRQWLGSFYGMGYGASFWTSTEYTTDGAIHFYLFNDAEGIYNGSINKQYGYSVRCVRD